MAYGKKKNISNQLTGPTDNSEWWGGWRPPGEARPKQEMV